MPYERRGKCVYRKDIGKRVGCSSSVGKGKNYLKKLYAVSDKKTPAEDEELVNKILSI